MRKNLNKLTLSVHAGSTGDSLYGGTVNPIYPSAAYDYEHDVIYPRYFNTPNQLAAAEKLCALEHAESGLMFSSGMDPYSRPFSRLLGRAITLFSKTTYMVARTMPPLAN